MAVAANFKSGKLKAALFLAACTAGLATPAAANRCGNALSIDAPTTLSRVARQCNVSLAELKSANRGVDPANVRPGERLAIPDEGGPVLSLAAPAEETPAANAGTSNPHPYIASDYAPVTDDPYRDNDLYEVESTWRDARSDAYRIRVRDQRVSREYPAWLAPEPKSGGHYSGNDRLSYQQRSKLRLAAANNTARFANQPAAPFANGDTASVTLVECDMLRDQNGARLHEVRKIMTSPGATYVAIDEKPNGARECTIQKASVTKGGGHSGQALYPSGEPGVPLARFTDNTLSSSSGWPRQSSRAINLSLAPAAPSVKMAPSPVSNVAASNFSLQGNVVAVSDGCLILRTDDDDLWRLAAAPPTGDLLGKHVTVWGVPAAAAACGGGPAMTVSHAVYADPVGKR
ncbi:MAG: DUF5818 domain-containing protein [Pseudomonadota bacterium]